MELGQLTDGTLQVPPLSNLNLAGWYKYSSTPGQIGPAVIAGHIDSTAGAAVFYKIRYLTDGDRIDITLADKQVAVFSVSGLQQTAKTAFPTDSVYGATPNASLRLITCGGTFDYSTGHYLNNVIVYANLVS
jgi:sortase (surface protein transpeptidase)